MGEQSRAKLTSLKATTFSTFSDLVLSLVALLPPFSTGASFSAVVGTRSHRLGEHSSGSPMELRENSELRGDDVRNDGVQRWALYTGAGGAAGATFGATSAFLRGQPTLFMASAFGVNATIFTGTLLGLRAALLYATPLLETVLPPGRVPVACSAVAAAAVGGGFTAVVSGRSRALPAVALWGCIGWAGQSSVDAVNAWRRSQALALIRARQAPAGQVIDVAGPAAARAEEASEPVASANASGSGSSSQRWDWLPFHFGTDHSARLSALRRRLQEINEDLGEAEPLRTGADPTPGAPAVPSSSR